MLDLGDADVGMWVCGRGNVSMQTGECEECGYAGGGMWVGYVLKCGSWVQRYKRAEIRGEKIFRWTERIGVMGVTPS